MPAFAASAPGKVILFGEHAVVYGRPAIAVPVTQVQAKATINANLAGPAGQVWIAAPDINLSKPLADLPSDHPFALAVQGVMQAAGVDRLPALRLQIRSSIPIAAGLGSGAAVSVAIARALSAFLGRPLPEEKISAIAFQADRAYHGTPSGIDNTVITYGQPIYFIQSQPFEPIRVSQALTLVIGNTGVLSSTRQVVGDVRQRWQANQPYYENLFDQIKDLTRQARADIEAGRLPDLGERMNQNHALLQEIGVSSPELDALVSAARQVGALGAKLCGAGCGGNMVALAASPDETNTIAAALKNAGAVDTIITTVGKR